MNYTHPILYVISDINNSLRLQILDILANAEFEVVGFSSAAEAIEQILTCPPDALLLDQNLPDMSGQQMLDILAQRGINIPYIAIAAQEDKKRGVEMIQSGAFGYLIKDTDLPGLLPTTVEHLLKNYLAARKLQESQKKLLDSENKYKILFENSQGLLCTHNRRGILLNFNTAAANSLGYKTDELIGKNLYDLLHPKEKPLFNRYLQNVFREKMYKGEMTILHKNGQSRSWAYQNSVFKQPDGEEIVIGSAIDITQQTQQERELEKSRKAYKSLVENIPGITYQCKNDADWTLLFISAHIDKVTGYSSEELLHNKTTSYGDLIHPEDIDDVILAVEKAIKESTAWETEYRIRHKSGNYRWAYEKGTAVKDEHGEVDYLTGIILDITDKKNIEHELLYNESLMTALYDLSPIGIALNHFDSGAFIDVNDQLLEPTGYTRNEFMNLSYWDITPKEYEAKELKALESLKYSDRYGPFEKEYIRKDGSRYPVLLQGVTIEDLYGNKLIWSFVEDISDRKKAEAKIHSLLEITSKQNSRLKNFAHIVTHNLRSHSAGIIGLLDLLEEENPVLFENELLGMMKKASEHLQETIGDLTEVVSIHFEQNRPEQIPIRKFVQKNIDSLSAQIKTEEITIKNEVAEQFSVLGITSYLDSIIFNFTTNAIKYKSPDRDSYLIISAFQKDRFIQINFEDNGLGIDLEKHGNNLFGIYKTFHTHIDSRGVGLFITKNQIETMGGYIEVESEVGNGTTFKVYLPNSEE